MHRVKAQRSRTVISQMVGLLGTNSGYPLLLHTRFGIHTIGMRYPIDVALLEHVRDTYYRIVRIHRSLAPFRILMWHPRYRSVLELPAGYLARYRLRPDQIIDIRE
jgi:hypothetical protein